MPSPITVIAVPGVGLWPSLFAETVDHLGDLDRPAEIMTRPTEQLDLNFQVQFLAEASQRLAPAVVVGVSGGATLALALAIDGPAGLVGIVSHEPLVGPLELELHHRVHQAGTRLAGDPSPTSAMAFLAGLYCDGWDAAPPEARRWAEARFEVVCREVEHYAAFAPTLDQLELSIPHLSTVGGTSGPERHRVRDLLADSGAATATIADCGHLVLVEQPLAFATQINQFVTKLNEAA